MPEKHTGSGRRYVVTGKLFTWFPLDDDDTETEPLSIPLRIKLGVILDLSGQDLDAVGMQQMIITLLPGVEDRLREMDVNDFQAMFTTWQSEYALLNGATLGESSGSPA